VKENNLNYKLEQQQYTRLLLVQVFASAERIISVILCRTPLENPVCSSVHPNTVAWRHITHLALNQLPQRLPTTPPQQSEVEDVL